MYNEDFITRLTQLRQKKGVSARDMSLSLGQNPGYINNIESGKALPSMSGFFFICDYFGITPKDFFDTDNQDPQKIDEVVVNLRQLSDEQLTNIALLIRYIIK